MDVTQGTVAGAERYNKAIEKASVLLIFDSYENENSLRIL
jgi:hypothetical protein